MTKLPEFLVIGAARAGTTALHSYLRQHPQIFMPSIKEPNFFSFEGETLSCSGPGADYINNSITDLATYQGLFSDAPNDAICGEASPLYLFAPKAPERIKHHIPTARLIVILRNPIDQAFSHFLYATKQAIEPEPSFTKALNLENERLAAGWQPLFGYSRFPRYAEQLARFFEHFPREQVLIRTYEEFKEKPDQVLRDIFEYIGVNKDFHPDMSHKPNAGGVPKNRALQDFLMKSNPITRAVGMVVPETTRIAIRDKMASANTRQQENIMPPKAREILIDRLSPEIHSLGMLLGRDFSHWLR